MNWYKIENKADKAEVWIYEQIGESFWDGSGVSAKKFQKDLAAITAKQIDLHINSPGGHVFEGVTIYNLLKNHPANVTTYIDGLAASIASIIALAGEKVVMAANALMMIHNPSGFVMGTAEDMRKTADVLDKIRSTMTGVYAGKSGKPEDEINGMLDAETWMTADEAVSAGFADEIAGEMDLAACAKFIPVMAKAGFKNVPAKFGIANKIDQTSITNIHTEVDDTMDFKALTIEMLSKERPDLVSAIEGNARGELATRVTNLEGTVQAQAATIKDQEKKLLDAEKQATLRAEKELKLTADGIWAKHLAAIPQRLHEKVRMHVRHEDHVKDGVLDEAAFSKAVKDEVDFWAKETGANAAAGDGVGDVRGSSFPSKTVAGADDDKEDDAAVDLMLALAGQAVK